jgi:hypothetical protein
MFEMATTRNREDTEITYQNVAEIKVKREILGL